MMFVCGQCWRNGQLSEADKNKKYCAAKARHMWVLGSVPGTRMPVNRRRLHTWLLFLSLRWAKDRRVVLVSSNERKKWTTVRSLPTKKPIPSQFEVRAEHFWPLLYLWWHQISRKRSPHVVAFSHFLDLHACDCRQEVSVHWELHVCPQSRREGPLDLHEGKQQWVPSRWDLFYSIISHKYSFATPLIQFQTWISFMSSGSSLRSRAGGTRPPVTWCGRTANRSTCRRTTPRKWWVHRLLGGTRIIVLRERGISLHTTISTHQLVSHICWFLN